MTPALALATAPLCDSCGLACPLHLHKTVFDCKAALLAELDRTRRERDRFRLAAGLLFDYLDPTAEENRRLRLEVARRSPATPLPK
jgi:hypothetical protein